MNQNETGNVIESKFVRNKAIKCVVCLSKSWLNLDNDNELF